MWSGAYCVLRLINILLEVCQLGWTSLRLAFNLVDSACLFTDLPIVQAGWYKIMQYWWPFLHTGEWSTWISNFSPYHSCFVLFWLGINFYLLRGMVFLFYEFAIRFWLFYVSEAQLVILLHLGICRISHIGWGGEIVYVVLFWLGIIFESRGTRISYCL